MSGDADALECRNPTEWKVFIASSGVSGFLSTVASSVSSYVALSETR